MQINQEFSQLDDELRQDFYDDVLDCVRDLIECDPLLENSEGDFSDLINRMFRSIHTIKGNCNMVFLEPFVNSVHIIEELVQDVRSTKYAFAPAIGKLLITAIQAIHEQLTITVSNNSIDSECLQKIATLVDTVRKSEDRERVENALRASRAISDGHLSLNLVAINHLDGTAFSLVNSTDFEYFNYLSECRRDLDPLHDIRMTVQLKLVKILIQKLKSSISEDQVLAALYVFEYFKSSVSPRDSAAIERQVLLASGLLQHVQGWDDAMNLVLQSQETFDGKGFPLQLEFAQINPAAKVIHLVDNFISNALLHTEQGYKSSLFVAVKAVNKELGIHYSEELIQHFNKIIKQSFLDHPHW